MSKQEFFSLIDSGKISEAVNFAISSKIDRHIFFAALGDYFTSVKNYDLAKHFYVISLKESSNPFAQFGLGNLLLSNGLVKESISFFVDSSKSDTHSISSLLKIGMAERLLGNIKGSLAAYLLAKNKGYDKFIVDVNIAVLLSDMGEFESAGKYYERAISKAPDDPKAKFNYSLHLLSLGDFKKGFEYYESRPWCFRGYGEEWIGQKGKNVLILAEQGYGDLIQFSRFIPEVKQISNKVALSCDRKLWSFLSNLGLNEFFDLEDDSLKKANIIYSHYCRVLSIPFLMSLDIENHNFTPIPVDKSTIPFKTKKALRIGLCWQGGKRNHAEMIFNDKKRSVELGLLNPILELENVEFYSLQKDWKEPHPKIIDRMNECNNFLDTASLVENMDLVISVDTAVAHLSASIGKPVWMLSRLGGCWRWGNQGEETFWYPSMKIFRQTEMDDWSSVIDKVKNELVLFLNSR